MKPKPTALITISCVVITFLAAVGHAKTGGLYAGVCNLNFIFPSPPGLGGNRFFSSNAELRIPNRKGRIRGTVLTSTGTPSDIPIWGRAERVSYRRGRDKAIYEGTWSWNLGAYTETSDPSTGPFRIVLFKSIRLDRYKTKSAVRVNLKGSGPQPYDYRGRLNLAESVGPH